LNLGYTILQIVCVCIRNAPYHGIGNQETARFRAQFRVQMRKLLPLICLFGTVALLSSCLEDEIAPIIQIRSAAGDTISNDTVTALSNTVLTVIADTRDDQDLLGVRYFHKANDSLTLELEYAAPIFLTNRANEVQVDLSLPDSVFDVGKLSEFTVRAEDMGGNVTETTTWILTN
jgi:hypothetical protein